MPELLLSVFFFRYVRVLLNIFHQKSPSLIQEGRDTALQLHSLQTHATSFMQVAAQSTFAVLLAAGGAGTFVAGVSAETLFQGIGQLDTD